MVPQRRTRTIHVSKVPVNISMCCCGDYIERFCASAGTMDMDGNWVYTDIHGEWTNIDYVCPDAGSVSETFTISAFDLGDVDNDDLLEVIGNWGDGYSPQEPLGEPIPEPASLALIRRRRLQTGSVPPASVQ